MTYSAKDIEVLDGLNHIRLRPSMYIGSADADGIWHTFKELLDNALDEHLAGHADTICVFLEPDLEQPYYAVRDNGRGIPVEKHEKSGISTLTTVFTNLQAGGKFSKKAYKVSSGLHGIGLKAVTACSEWLSAVVWRKKQCWTQSFARGKYEGEPTRYKERDSEFTSGTEVSFWPDHEIFKKSKLDVDRVVNHIRSTAHLCPGLTFHVTLRGVEEVIKGNGLRGFVTSLVDGEAVIHDPIEINTDTVKAILLWSSETGEDERCHSFVNLSPTAEHGTHVAGFRRAIAKALNDFAKEPQKPDELRVGLVSAVSIFCENPEFKGQTKTKLGNAEADALVFDAVYPVLHAFFDRNKTLATKILDQAKRAAKNREQFKQLNKALGQLQVGSKNARGILPTKLCEAPGCPVDKRELFIVEGDSAGGSAKKARDPKFQELLPLKGKVVNALTKTAAFTLANEEVQAMIAAIGLTIDPKAKTCDLSRRRVGKVLLLCDADPDGQHISALLVGLFSTFAKELLQGGYVYMVESPLYRAKDYRGTQTWFGDSIADIEEQARLPKAKLLISRLKGHGEANSEDLRRYAMDARTRKLTQMTYNAEQAAKFANIMGDDADARKVLLNVGNT